MDCDVCMLRRARPGYGRPGGSPHMAEAGAARVRCGVSVSCDVTPKYFHMELHALLLQVEGTHVTRSSTCSTAPMKNETRLRFV